MQSRVHIYEDRPVISLSTLVFRILAPGAIGAFFALFTIHGIPALFDLLGRGMSFAGSLKEAAALTMASIGGSGFMHQPEAAVLTTLACGFVIGVFFSLNLRLPTAA